MSVKFFDWNNEKNEILKSEREISFEEVVLAVSGGKLLDIIENPNQKKYPGQKIFVVNIQDYVYLVPFIEDKNTFFLKTIIPSRKMTKKCLIKKAK